MNLELIERIWVASIRSCACIGMPWVHEPRQRAAGVSPADSTVSAAGRMPAARCGSWRAWNRALIVVAFAILIKPPDVCASIINCTYDAAGRLVGVQYNASTNLTHHYDHSGSIRQASAFTLPAADVAVAQSTFPGSPIVGVPFRVLITAANLSAARAAEVRLSSEFPTGHVLLSTASSAGTCSINGTTLTCDFGNLDAGEEIALEVSVRATATGQFPLMVSISAAGDPNPDNNLSSQSLAILALPSLTLQSSVAEGAAAEITWPAIAQGLLLEETTSLQPPAIWRPTEQPSLVGDTLRFPVVVEMGNRFYRLRLPD